MKASLKCPEFKCTLPLPVCPRCALPPTLILCGIDERWWWAAPAVLAALFLANAQLWLPCCLMAAVAAAILLWYWTSKRISITDRFLRYEQVFRKVAPLQTLRTNVPDLTVSVPLRYASVSRDLTTPVSILEESITCFDHVHLLFSFSDLERSNVHPVLLNLLISKIIELTKLALSDARFDSDAAVQVDFVLLPERPTQFDIQVTGRNSRLLYGLLETPLNSLPTVAVRWPLVFSYRRWKDHVGRKIPSFATPFFSLWQSKLDGQSGISYSDAAIIVFNISPPLDLPTLTANDYPAWRKLGEVPDSLVAAHILLLQTLNKFEEAIAVFEDQIKASPLNVSLRFEFAVCLNNADLPERAAAVCQQIIEEVPSFANVYPLMAHLMLSMRRPLDAQQILLSAPQNDRSAVFWYQQARVALTLEDVQRSLGHLNTAILKDLSFSLAYRLRAQIFFEQEKYSLALEDILLAEKYGGLSSTLLQLKVSVLKRLGHSEQIIKMLSDALHIHPADPSTLLMRSESFADAGKTELALDDVEQALRISPDNSMAFALRARIHLDQENPSAALADAESAIAVGDITPQILLLRGIAHLMLEDCEQAIEDLNRACEMDPSLIIARYHLSRAKTTVGQIKSAVSDLTIALSLVEDWVDARIDRGFLYLRQADLELAAVDFDRVLQLAPLNLNGYRGRSLVHEAKRETRAALALLHSALQIDPDDIACRMNRSRILIAENDLIGATTDLDNILSTVPNLESALLSRAEVKIKLGCLDEAKRDFDAVLEEHPDLVPALIGRSVIHDLNGDTDLSQKDFETATMNQPQNAIAIEVSCMLMKAFVWLKEERFAEVIRLTTEIIELDPENYPARRYRANAYWYSDSFVEAVQEYSHLMETLPEPDPSVLNGRGQVYAELGEYELALKDLEQAVEIQRRSGDTGLSSSLSGLGKTLTGLGRYDEAEAALRESMSIRPDNGWLHFNCGLLHLARNEPGKACICFRVALHLENPRLNPRKRIRAQAFLRSQVPDP
ncbi:MAG: tetratricopeptide repeat protein [Planctomyces sp.]|nr:tetratricopeptide repeat protein [Planctomyces sp.]